MKTRDPYQAVKPAPVDAGIKRVWVRVTLENPRVARDIPYSCGSPSNMYIMSKLRRPTEYSAVATGYYGALQGTEYL